MFNDPFTQFIVTIIVSIVSAILPFLLYFWKQHQIKEFNYEIVTNTSVLKISSEYKDNLKITYQDTPVQDLKLIYIKFANSGNVPIEANHFDQDQPVRIFFSGDQTKVLTHEIVDKFPKVLDVKTQVDANHVSILPIMLNSGDTFSIKLLISDFFGKISVEGRIVGVKEIKEVQKIANRNLRKSAFTELIRIPRIIGLFFLDIFGRGKDTSESTATILGLLFIVVTLLFATGIWKFYYVIDYFRYILGIKQF